MSIGDFESRNYIIFYRFKYCIENSKNHIISHGDLCSEGKISSNMEVLG